MSRDEHIDQTSGEELARLLVNKSKPRRARSTTALFAILLVLLGVLIGVPLGRATAPTEPTPVVVDEGTGG